MACGKECASSTTRKFNLKFELLKQARNRTAFNTFQYLQMDSNHRHEAYETSALPLSYVDISWHTWIRTMILRLTAGSPTVERYASDTGQRL